MPSRPAPDVFNLLLPAALLLLFASMLHQIRWLALISLAVSLAVIVYRELQHSYEEILQIFALRACRWSWLLLAGGVGIGLAMLLRWNQSGTLHPSPLHPFLMVAVLVGMTEELLFRGGFFGHLERWKGPGPAIVFSALLHAAYKAALFVSTAPAAELLFLGSITFAAGLLLGYWRKAAASIWPCIVFHALFDLWVYGDRAAPWWVW